METWYTLKGEIRIAAVIIIAKTIWLVVQDHDQLVICIHQVILVCVLVYDICLSWIFMFQLIIYRLSFLFSITKELFVQLMGSTDCGQGSSNSLYDYGSGTTLEYCQQNCLGMSGCTDIVWAPGNGHCNTFDGCDNAGNGNSWFRYALIGKPISFLFVFLWI